MNEKTLRSTVRSLLIEQAGKHLCLDGTVVSLESQECYDDICKRIEDAIATRNLCAMQSDARDHYNGILKVLRRKHRKSKKFVDSLHN